HVTASAVEFLLDALKKEKEAIRQQKLLQVDYFKMVKPWEMAMQKGGMTGKVFSPLTINYYTEYVSDFLNKHRILSTATFKKEMMTLPRDAFARRYKLYKAAACFAKFLIQQDLMDAAFLDEVKPLSPKRHTPPKRQTVDET